MRKRKQVRLMRMPRKRTRRMVKKMVRAEMEKVKKK